MNSSHKGLGGEDKWKTKPYSFYYRLTGLNTEPSTPTVVKIPKRWHLLKRLLHWNKYRKYVTLRFK